MRFEPGKCTVDLALLMGDPARLASVLGAEAAFIDDQQGSFGQPIRQRMQAQAKEARHRISRNEFSAGIKVKKFENDLAVIQHRSIRQRQRGYLAEGIVGADRIGWVERVGRDDFDRAGKAEHEAAIFTFRPKGEAGAERRRRGAGSDIDCPILP